MPVIEFRLRDFVGSSQLNKINYHIIFSNELSIEEIEEEFLKKLEITEYENRSLTKDNLMTFGKKVRNDTPDNKKSTLPSSDLKIGFNNFTIELSKIEELLKKNLFKDKYIRVIGQTEWNDFRWDGSPSDKRALINGVDFVFSASPTIDSALQSKEKLAEQEVNNCLLHCSDAHQFSDGTYTSKILGHCFTWIKADTTFEGLKQVIYEPTSRLKLQESKPEPPLHKLEKVRLEFPEDVKWDNDKFCFAGFDDNIVFSPNLTCIIGGRGSGKSTLLNLIAKKIGKGDTKFFEKVDSLDIETSVKFLPETIENIEYLAQNTIEKFATDIKAFTEAIYNRLNKKSKGELESKEAEIIENLQIFDDQIALLKNRVGLHNELLNLRSQLKINNNIVSTFSDKTFVDAKGELTRLQKEKDIILESRNRYKLLYEDLKAIKEKYQAISEPTNNYDTYYNELLNKLNTIYVEYSSEDYTIDKEEIKNIDERLKEIEEIIQTYLEKKGLSPENIEDAKNASQKIIELKNERKNNLNNLKETKQKINNFSTNELDDKISEFQTSIESELSKINAIFKKISDDNPSEVKLIEVKYELNQDIFDKVFDELELVLNIREEISSSRVTFKGYIKSLDFEEVLTCQTGKEFIEKIETKSTLAYKKVEEIFSDDLNFNIYKLLIEKERRNIKDNKILRVYYDNKPLDNSSFGQKCTAAIVILLSLGNNPIIIDEPEAHLDSSLIANYLVELIKQQKEQRQIIFATHNANFVLNADAELIIKLENIDGTTSVTNFTIEDLRYRKDLLKLEGGKEAFKKRERKYNI